ncbi:Gfo/Idh/MocA family protein [Candidatus Margulisiibacteriota bacterium]
MRFLVIGGGSIGKRHLKNLIALGQEAAVCEPQAERAGQIRKDLNVDVFPDLNAAFERPFDAVLITNPNIYHLQTAIRAAEAGCHLFIEKPLSHTLKGVDELISLIRSKKLKTLMGCNWKFHPSFRLMKKMLDDGAIGKVLSFSLNFGQYLPDWHPWEDYRKGYSANRSLGGGVLLDSHEFDYLQWFLGEIDEVFCVNAKVSDLEIDTEDVAETIIRTKGGALGHVHLDYIQRPYRRQYAFYGSQGTLEWDWSAKKVSLFNAKRSAWEIYEEDPEYDLNQMYVDEIKHFINILHGKVVSVTDINKAKSVLQVIDKAKNNMS